MEKLNEIIKEAINNEIHVLISFDEQKGTTVYKIGGFSKSVYAEVYYDKDSEKIICTTLNGQVDEIESFKDLAMVAYNWNASYASDVLFGWDKKWAPVFASYGWPMDEPK